MGSLVGGLLTKKKKKKIQGKINQGYRDSAAAQVESQRLAQLQANFGSKQEKIQQLREGRIRRAQVLAAATNSGAGNSTVTQSGYGSAETSAFANLGNINVMEGFSEAISKQNEEYMKQQGNLQVLGAKLQTQNEKAQFIGSIFDTAFSVATLGAGGIEGMALKAAGGMFSRSGAAAPISSLT